MKMKKRLLKYDKNKRRSRHGHKCSKYKTCMMMLICIKQHFSSKAQFMRKLSNIEAELKKKHCL